jgi:alpha-tubulin suppressor-like RCC1 family protein
MEKQFALGTYYLLALDHQFQSLYTAHYPKEIVHLIIKFYCRLFKIKIKCGQFHFMILFDNNIYSWGQNRLGQLGLGHFETINKPTKINLPDVVKISCGYSHTMALDKNGNLYAWGSCGSSQLGLDVVLNLTVSENHPCLVPLNHFTWNDPIKKIVAGAYFSMVQTASGKIYVCGSNYEGELGSNNSYERYQVEKFIRMNPTDKIITIKKIACGYSHSIALATTKEIFVWGAFGWENHNYKNTVPRDFGPTYSFLSSNIINVVCGKLYSAIITNEGDIYFQGKFYLDSDNNITLPKKITCPNLKKIACGSNHIMILTNSGEVYVQGCYVNGQLGLSFPSDIHSLQKLDLANIKDIVCGEGASFAITEMNEIYIWGNGYGRIPKKFTF